jgi:hypothetical protein
MRFLSSVLPATVVALAALAFPGCGNDSGPAKCVPGASVACTGNGCSGFQVCNADGTYTECVCGPHPFATSGPNSGLLGASCGSAVDCRKGLDCVAPDSTAINGEGPSGGMCLAQCAVGHDFCKSVDATSKCITLYDGGTPSDPSDDVSYCLPGCKLGTQPNELDKCRGRVDVVCTQETTGASTGYCRPACRSDVDCNGRSCDLRTGLCTDRAPSGSPIGSACDPTGTTCAGTCIQHGGGYTECSGICAYDTAGCGQTDAKPPLQYFCYLDPATNSGAGDLGSCAKLCDCDTDCGRPDAVCEPKPIKSATGRAGVCGSVTFPSGQLRSHIPC